MGNEQPKVNTSLVPKVPDAIEVGDYELGDFLGKGKYAKVYRAIHKQTKEVFAIKQCFVENIVSRRNEFLEEARIMDTLSNIPNIIRCEEVLEKSGDVLIVQELCELGDLFDAFIVSNNPYKIPTNEALKILY